MCVAKQENYRAQYQSLLEDLDAEDVAAGRTSSTDKALALAEEIVQAPIPLG